MSFSTAQLLLIISHSLLQRGNIEEEMLEVIILCVASVASAASAKLITNCRKHDELDQFLDEEEINIDTFVLPPRPECPLCMLPFPFEADRVSTKECCGYMICKACEELAYYGELDRRSETKSISEMQFGFNCSELLKCPFCRENPDTEAVLDKPFQLDNGNAMTQLAHRYANGNGVPSDEEKAIKLYHMAARANSTEACVLLGNTYYDGGDGESSIQKDKGKAMRLYSRGARLGDPMCVLYLGDSRREDGKDDYVQYYIKAACAGVQEGLDEVKEGYIDKKISKDEYAHALRSFQVADDEINSDARKKFNKSVADGSNMNLGEGIMLFCSPCKITYFPSQ
jgi:hypothetical protein